MTESEQARATQHHRAFVLSLGWTLALLFLGSVVHATESSLACPDWPTCYGSMVPVMEGGVFWEHLHRLWAGGLLIFWAAGIWLGWREGASARVRWWAVAGFALLLVQAVLGGLTVLMGLPDAVSTAHLAAAFLFLILAAALAVVTGPRWGGPEGFRPDAGWVGPAAWTATGIALVQAVLGGAVRHADAGMACPDVPLCRGEWVPALTDPMVTLHFSHRVLGVVLAVLVFVVAAGALRRAVARRVRMLAWLCAALVLLQVALGVVSITSTLAVVPVSLHTLGGAVLIAALTALGVLTREPRRDSQEGARAGSWRGDVVGGQPMGGAAGDPVGG